MAVTKWSTGNQRKNRKTEQSGGGGGEVGKGGSQHHFAKRTGCIVIWVWGVCVAQRWVRRHQSPSSSSLVCPVLLLTCLSSFLLGFTFLFVLTVRRFSACVVFHSRPNHHTASIKHHARSKEGFINVVNFVEGCCGPLFFLCGFLVFFFFLFQLGFSVLGA